jgi:regulator of replication initiation timing
VDTSEFKDALFDAFDNLEQAVLTALRKRLRQSNDRLIEQYQIAEVEVNKGASTGDEVLALKRLIQAQQTKQDQMKEEIKQNKATVAFLVSYLMPISQEVSVRLCPSQ